MGKVTKPLTIVVFSPLDEWPEIVKLEKQGHRIIRNLEDMWKHEIKLEEADIIMGPRCWYMTGLHRKHLTQAIKQARLRRYGTVAKKKKEADDNVELEGHDGSGTNDSDIDPATDS